MTHRNAPSAQDPLQHQQRRARRPAGAAAPLRRSSDERVVAGVCGGIALFVGARPATVRWLWIASLLPSLGVTALAYPAMWWLLPPAPEPVGRARRV
jgi:phage shock protein PspC (stress-responsive transcriptional regulator)